ncbi:DUF1285 domain-containing protein [Sphingomonas morindae]|uniref:DUF1285 domain-containing protein n=1 Tax=Sphingomonas morindae TaxID=1541170 RepID=A0ABY4X701_9SPHN|nr:DUF1285 domain-containing protein [Sphingomonas morindae]USI72630.1 DUF1285 domain-containing protein [Sphingomonas morindae]
MAPASPLPESLAALDPAAIAALAEGQGLPPVELWSPPACGDSAMRILADGQWLHEGAPITRPALVRLFSTILRGEPDGGFVLVTPVERLRIAVDDAPFVAVEMRSDGEGPARRLSFRTNVGDVVVAGAAHPLRVGARPYVRVRGRLDALIARPVFYELASLALAEPPAADGRIGLWSDGVFFPFDGPDAA